MSFEPSLFNTSLISAKVQETLPEGYVLRPLKRSDFANGHLDVLRDLAYLGEITEKMWTERFDWMLKCNGTYYVAVIEDPSRDGGKIVATGTLMVEKKFLYKLGTQGHIEDVAVIGDQQGKKLGVKLLHALDHIAEQVGCYKTILDCSEENEGFYVKCGYEKAGSEMHHYYDHEAEEHGV
ncbi:acyl-CoA N-acyltransferase [Trichodelitschia bisporula]|uniref:Glucosamine 6-phosphate N-acetyltransferase n=1 Tax=Trichodelitschia bisporula TaxID=703511 RepID=A0A6G1I1J1_9PEZI|nr:acyl-CoA N-acyltransferase [Trichodelitschia bisporula]